MAWKDMPPAVGSTVFFDNLYAWETQFDNAFRERDAIASGTISGSRTPLSSFVYYEGTLTGATDNGDGTVTLTDDTADDPTSPPPYTGVGWVDGASVKRWLVGSGQVFNGTTLADFVAGSYKIAVFPKEDPDASGLGDANLGRVYSIYDVPSATSVKIADDGYLTNALNGKSVASYAGYAYQIIKDQGGLPRGYAWFQRFPPRPNEGEFDYGTITASTTTTITDDRDGGDGSWNTPKNWSDATLKDKDGNWPDCMTKVPGGWKRIPVTGVADATDDSPVKLKFAGQPAAPLGEYWLVRKGSWWRPEFRFRLARAIGRTGVFYSPVNGGRPWDAAGSNGPGFAPLSNWWNGYTDSGYYTHDPATDDVTAASVFVNSVTLPGASDPVTVFDADTYLDTDYELVDYADTYLNPWMYWSIRGRQLRLRNLVQAAQWLDPSVDYDGSAVIEPFTLAGWQRHHTSEDTRNQVIDTVDTGTGTATFSGSIAMPHATKQQGAYASLACWFEILDDDGAVMLSGNGDVTANVLTATGLSLDHEGHGITIAFQEKRRYERRVRHVYPVTVIIPDDDGSGKPAAISEANPGTWTTTDPSTKYAEYDKFGKLLEDGPDFLVGETARYVADNFHDPTTSATDVGFARFYDRAYQGRPNAGTEGTFKRWEAGARNGTATAGGTFYLADASQLWWVSNAPLVTHEGTATGGSTTTLADTTKSGNGYWLQPDRFSSGGGMVLEVSNDGGKTFPERRPVTAYDCTTQTITVAPAFPWSTASKKYRLREPGADASKGAVLNLWRGRKLEVTRAADGTSTTVVITHSDDDHVYFDRGKVTVAAGDTYQILQLEPDTLVQWRPSADESVRVGAKADNTTGGWVELANAVQDDRGQPWKLDPPPPISNLNLATIVANFGLFRRGDIPHEHIWRWMYAGLDCLRWTRGDVTWSSRLDPAVSEQNLAEAGADTDSSMPENLTCASRKSYAESTSFASAPRTNDASGPPHAWTDHANSSAPDPGSFAHMDMSVQYAYAVAPAPAVMNREITIMVKGVLPYGEEGNPFFPRDRDEGYVGSTYYAFDDNGTGIKFRKYGVVHRETTHAAELRILVGDNSLSTPRWGRCPTDSTVDGSTAGYYAVAQHTVIKWDVSGGLKYVS